jgi:hypothetical protein
MVESAAPGGQPETSKQLSAEKIYNEICTHIRVTDDVSFKLLGLVPLVSGVAVITLLLENKVVRSPTIFLI